MLNALDRQRWESRDQPRLAIITWIERTTTTAPPARPRQADLVEYEMLCTEAAIAV